MLPKSPVYTDCFKEMGHDSVVKIEALPIDGPQRLRLIFESCNSPRPQGVWLRSDDSLLIDGQAFTTAEFWADAGKDHYDFTCKGSALWLYNIWLDGDARRSQAYSSGMLVQEVEGGRRYRCQDFGPDADFSRLVFRIVRRPEH
ncbi:MAG: hypothetical protein JJU33_05000 [Phycisphaerales bacterium]|nr:hypothetical protein [Phycisphaerales bacterium]